MVSLSPSLERPNVGLVYAWAGFGLMWGVWVSFVIFLAEPRAVAGGWPLPTVNRGGAIDEAWLAGGIDLGLVALFGLQHSVMARPWFKRLLLGRMPEAFERCTYVHMANLALFTLIVFWQPIPFDVWNITDEVVRKVLWLVFGGGWLLLFMGAMSFGIRELLGLDQMMAWRNGRPAPPPRLKTGGLYRWLRHPMYAGVLTGIWAVPRMTAGHLLLAAGFTGYVLIALRYEEHDLLQRFGRGYANWRRTLGGREPE